MLFRENVGILYSKNVYAIRKTVKNFEIKDQIAIIKPQISLNKKCAPQGNFVFRILDFLSAVRLVIRLRLRIKRSVPKYPCCCFKTRNSYD